MNSRAKGAAAEREVAKLLQQWWRQIEPACIFKRTPGSGGWAHGTEARETFGTAGDLVTDAKRFPFSVEAKRREEWCWANVVAHKPSPVWGWWVQTQNQAREVDKVPMLLFRKSREPWRVMLPKARGIHWRLSLEYIGNAGDLFGVNVGPNIPAVTRLEHLLTFAPEHFALDC